MYGQNSARAPGPLLFWLLGSCSFGSWLTPSHLTSSGGVVGPTALVSCGPTVVVRPPSLDTHWPSHRCYSSFSTLRDSLVWPIIPLTLLCGFGHMSSLSLGTWPGPSLLVSSGQFLSLCNGAGGLASSHPSILESLTYGPGALPPLRAASAFEGLPPFPWCLPWDVPFCPGCSPSHMA